MNLRLGDRISSCKALAALLSTKYATYEPFDVANGDLNSHLDKNGILLSICTNTKGVIKLELDCSELNPREKHMSTSWIHENVTGWRTFVPPIGLPGEGRVGYILDPKAVSLSCLYPVDAVTAKRDPGGDGEYNDRPGCGPIATDPKYGSQGYDRLPSWKRFSLRTAVNMYRKKFFNNYTSWSDIPCDSFFQHLFDFANEITLVVDLEDDEKRRSCDERTLHNDSVFVYQTPEQYEASKWEYIMKHPICDLDGNNSTPTPAPSDDDDLPVMMIYKGDCSWTPPKWNEMVAAMRGILAEYSATTNYGIWNEIVVDKPDSLENVVQAIFFINGDDDDDDDDANDDDGYEEEAYAFKMATKLAKKWGKHLLQVNLSAAEGGGPIFQCNSSFPHGDETPFDTTC